MTLNSLTINTALQIQKHPSEIFEAIVNPELMKNYFISKSTGRMEEGANLIWNFPEFEVDCPVRISTILKDELISYHWDIEDKEMLVEIRLEVFGNDSTVVRITEGNHDVSDKGIAWLKGNTEGWANFLNCLKAYLEFGINLRKGGFDFRKPV